MPQLLEDAVVAVKRLPSVIQDQIAAIMIEMADPSDADRADEHIALQDVAAVEEGLAQILRGKFAADAEVEAAFRRFKA